MTELRAKTFKRSEITTNFKCTRTVNFKCTRTVYFKRPEITLYFRENIRKIEA